MSTMRARVLTSPLVAGLVAGRAYRWVHALTWLSACVVLAVLAIRFTVPIADGDLFWHLKYAEQMLERGTLVPDHTLYSWTPSSNATIYCAWLAQLVLYGLWKLGGFEALFALRYLLALGCAALLLHFTRASKLPLTPATVAIGFVALIGSAPVMVNLKPEMLSVAFTYATLWAYFNAKRVDGAGGDARGYLALVPMLMLVWVNMHGGFALMAPPLAAILAGEIANRALGSDDALRPRTFRTFVVAWLATGLAVFATPYGAAYPWQLATTQGSGGLPAAAYEWNAAHQRLWHTLGSTDMLVELFVIMGSVLLALMVWRARGAKRRVDVAIVLLLAVAVALYAWYLRTTYLLPALFGFAALHLLREPISRAGALGEKIAHRIQARAGTAVRSLPDAQSSNSPVGPLGCPVLAAAASALVLVIGLRAMTGALYPSGRSDFFGLGINYEAPVAEAEFVARHALPRDLYNVFDAGGYLLWRMHPTHRVMTDSRAFPYRDWFDEQVSFTDGARFEAFTSKYRADLAVIDLEKAPVWRSFARSREWHAVFYGPTAAVFVRRDHAATAGLALAAAQEIASLRNPRTAERVFAFAAYVGDYPSAWRVLAQLEGSLARPFGRGLASERLEAMRAYREAIEAVQAQRFEQALPALARALEGRVVSDRERALLQLLKAINTPGRSADAVAKLRTGIERIVSPQTGDASGR